ncbi:MAG: ATP-dependent RecD-like DNA helicase [Synergistaceae bacterium]|nr:ATP-dependent RecD-like DNA helicase [Synergistaceae bacterium]
MEKLQCVIERITYHNEENGYSVVKVSANGYSDIVAAVGIMPEVHVGSIFNLYGSWKIHPKFGQQFSFERCEETLPATVNGIMKYLGSGLIKGVGSVYAKRIVDTFGDDTLNILDNEPDRLSEVPGLGAKRVAMIKKSWIEQQEVKNIMLFLQSHDVSTSLAAKIFKHYGNDSIAVITENPYRLADDIWGIGFKTADSIAKKLGYGHERFERLRSGIFYTLNKLSELGHCFSYRDELIKAAGELLEVDEDLIAAPLDKMIKNNDLIQDDTAIYLPVFYYSEVGTANRLLNLIDSGITMYMGTDMINSRTVAGSKSINYDDSQIEAIKAALENKVFVLTGGPGTGKTTTTMGIIETYQERGAKILLAAPTGRAAKRMSEVTRMEAKTIHRLLEMKPSEGFQRNENNKLTGDVLIVDECSMIDIILMNSLMKAVPDNMSVIFVGDVDQLPSVGAGKVLSDMLASGVIPYVRLDKIFRQAQRSRIITNAHKINHGEMPYLTDKNSDFLFMAEEEDELALERSQKAADRIVKLCTEIMPQWKINSDDIQVLTPMRRGAVGSAELNLRLQAALNPENVALKRAGFEYRVKDRVMQIRNNYDKAVFNGDIGIVTSISPEDNTLTVNFDGRRINYDVTDLDELVLAYATTIHKSQGSEFPYVIMPVMMSHYVMLQRNLLYTGVTRAKKGLIIVGEKKAVYIAVKNNKIVERNTKLAERLRNKTYEYLDEEDED